MVSAKIFQGWLVVGWRGGKRKEEADLKEKKMTRKMKGWGIYIGVLIIVFTACNHFFMFSEVPTESRAGTISPGDNVISTRYGVGEKDIQRYDVLIFTPPDKPEMTYIKRVIGLPGETIEVRNGKVYADGVELDNSFIKSPQNRKGDGTYVVPEGCYFFLGDNRNNSNDSRFWKQKYVPAENIKVKARCVIYPFADAGWL